MPTHDAATTILVNVPVLKVLLRYFNIVSFYFSIARLGGVQCLYRVMQRCRKMGGGDFARTNLRAAKQNGAQPYPLSGTRSAYDSATNVACVCLCFGLQPPQLPRFLYRIGSNNSPFGKPRIIEIELRALKI